MSEQGQRRRRRRKDSIIDEKTNKMTKKKKKKKNIALLSDQLKMTLVSLFIKFILDVVFFPRAIRDKSLFNQNDEDGRKSFTP